LPRKHPDALLGLRGCGPAQLAAGAGATARPGHGAESARNSYVVPCPRPGGPGAGQPGDRQARPPAAVAGATAAGTGRSSGAGPGIAFRPDPVAGISPGHGAGTSGASGRRARAAADVGGAAGPRACRQATATLMRPVACQNSCTGSDLGFYPGRSCSFASSISS
jgi:hypothetical protein